MELLIPVTAIVLVVVIIFIKLAYDEGKHKGWMEGYEEGCHDTREIFKQTYVDDQRKGTTNILH